MRLLKQALAVLGTVVVIAILAALVTPKTAHAIVATAVQVVNTYANPAAVSRADDPGRSPARLYLLETLAPGTQGSELPLLDANTGAAYVVPAGKRLAVDRVSVDALAPTGKIVTVLLVNTSAAFVQTAMDLPLISQGATGDGSTFYSNTLDARDYVDQGQKYSVSATHSPFDGSVDLRINVSGHLVDCTNGGGC